MKTVPSITLAALLFLSFSPPLLAQEADTPDSDTPDTTEPETPTDTDTPDPDTTATETPTDTDAYDSQAARNEGLDYWEDFIHYLRIANLELAKSNGKKLVEMNIDDEDLLAVVDELAPYRDYERTLVTAQKMEDQDLVDVAKAVEQRVEQARLNLARDPKRVRRSIDLLDDGLRSRINATERLKKAGEFAAPGLVEVLRSGTSTDKALQPYAQQALVDIGRAVVGPLCVALPDLLPVPKQQVATVLAQIGYPMALPFLKAELARDDIDSETRKVIEVAFQQILEKSSVPHDLTAEQLFLLLAEDYYARPDSFVLQPEATENLLWDFATDIGLTYRLIPTPVFHDVMAMRLSRHALRLNPRYPAALSLWLAANFRRENNLGDVIDPSYPDTLESPHYYATLAGPTHLLPALGRAIVDRDSELALDTIRALDATSTTAERIGQEIQPLLAAMLYNDRRVRFEAAFALARSLPRVQYEGSGRVVPVLAEAVREVARPYVVVIARNPENGAQIQQLMAAEYGVVYSSGIDDAARQAALLPGVDLIVLWLDPIEADAAVAAIHNDVKLMGAGVLVLTDPDAMLAVNEAMHNRRNVRVASTGSTSEELLAAASAATGGAIGNSITIEQATQYAMTALELLLDLTKEDHSEYYNPSDAEPALVAALHDARNEVVLGSAKVLARLEGERAQRAIADAALDESRTTEMRVPLLRSLAESARLHGNLLADAQLNLLLRLVRQSDGEIADAAAEAHGALDLPTSNAVEFILQD